VRARTGPFRTDRPAVAEFAAGAIVIDARTRRLLILHQADEDRWCFPKGHVEPGESPRDAARREIAEETGLAAVRLGREVGLDVYRFYDPRRDRSVVKAVLYFAARTDGGELRLEPGFDEARWVSATEAGRRLGYPAERALVRRSILRRRRQTKR